MGLLQIASLVVVAASLWLDFLGESRPIVYRALTHLGY